jgi:nitrite reductase/ring-hydroxylating ferredoxin subunit
VSASLEFVCRRDELNPGEMKAFTVGRTRIVLCRTQDSFAALRNICSHHGAALSGGRLGGTNLPCPVVGTYEFGRAGEIIRCPRHGYEFDIWTGRSLHNPEGDRVKAYRVVEQGDEVYVELESS